MNLYGFIWEQNNIKSTKMPQMRGTYLAYARTPPMKGGNTAPLLINFIPSNGTLGIMRLIHKLPVTPTDPTQADANQLIRLQEPLPEYGENRQQDTVSYRQLPPGIGPLRAANQRCFFVRVEMTASCSKAAGRNLIAGNTG